MKKIFVTYGDAKFAVSKKQLAKEAKAIGLFDKVLCYGPEDMPLFIKANPMQIYSRGGGYWYWKAWMVWNTMQQYPNAMVVYSDAGNTLNKNIDEWNYWFKLMETNDALVQVYRTDVDYGWDKIYPGRDVNPSVKVWSKKLMLDYYDPQFGHTRWHDYPSSWSGMLIAKNNSPVAREWMEASIMHPELLIDAFGPEAYNQMPEFIVHRHDQSLLSAAAYLCQERYGRVAIIEETAESHEDAAIRTSRRILKKEPLKTQVVKWLKSVLGEDLYRKIYH